MTTIAELYGYPTGQTTAWKTVVGEEACPFLGRRCRKTRKSAPEISIGTCAMDYGPSAQPVVTCPHRFLERDQVFSDCLHLLALHEPGNELRLVSEVRVPGGSIDCCVASACEGKARDFVGLELQTVDTTGTVWPERQRFLLQNGIRVKRADAQSPRAFGMNWKMTAKTTLVQLNHKVGTFERLGKRLVIAMQDRLLEYMRAEFAFGHIRGQRNGDPVQLRVYELRKAGPCWHLRLKERVSTDARGIRKCLGLRGSGKADIAAVLRRIEARLAQSRLLAVGGAGRRRS